MTSLTMAGHLALLTRARTALADPAVLSASGREALIADMEAAERRIAASVPRSAHVATIQHDTGYDVFAAYGRDSLDEMLARFCRERWSVTGDDRDPATLDDATIIRRWFDGGQDDLKTMEIVDDGLVLSHAA